MSVSYTLKESFSGFKRTKLSTFVSIVTISISLLLLGIFAVLTINTSRFIDTLRDKVEMEAFLQEPMSRDEISDLIKTVTEMPGIENVVYVSKEDAAQPPPPSPAPSRANGRSAGWRGGPRPGPGRRRG